MIDEDAVRPEAVKIPVVTLIPCVHALKKKDVFKVFSTRPFLSPLSPAITSSALSEKSLHTYEMEPVYYHSLSLLCGGEAKEEEGREEGEQVGEEEEDRESERGQEDTGVFDMN